MTIIIRPETSPARSARPAAAWGPPSRSWIEQGPTIRRKRRSLAKTIRRIWRRARLTNSAWVSVLGRILRRLAGEGMARVSRTLMSEVFCTGVPVWQIDPGDCRDDFEGFCAVPFRLNAAPGRRPDG